MDNNSDVHKFRLSRVIAAISLVILFALTTFYWLSLEAPYDRICIFVTEVAYTAIFPYPTKENEKRLKVKGTIMFAEIALFILSILLWFIWGI